MITTRTDWIPRRWRNLLSLPVVAVLSAGCWWPGASASPAPPPGSWRTISDASAWSSDAEVLIELVERGHPSVVDSPPTDEFADQLRPLLREDRLSPRERLRVLVEALARLRDVHTGVMWNSLQLQSAPLRFERFRDGIHVVAADPKYDEWLGARLTDVGTIPVGDAVERVTTLFPEESNGAGRRRAHTMLHVPELLDGLGLLERRSEISYGLRKSGRYFRVTIPDADWGSAGRARAMSRLPSGATATGAPGRAARPYWFEKIRGSNTIFFRFNAVVDAEDSAPLAQFSAELLAELERGADRLVIDIRENPGGMSHLSRPLIEGLQRLSRINAFGGLFVLIGPRTGSAGVQFAFALEKCTRAVFVGEPTGQGPIFYSDPSSHVLPNTGVGVRISTTRWVMSFPGDLREALGPDLYVPRDFGNFESGADSALALAVSADTASIRAFRRTVANRQSIPCEVQYFGLPGR